MRGKFIDLVGRTFKRLTILEKVGTDDKHNSLWLCRCICGNQKIINNRHLNKTISCGCTFKEAKTTHGLTKTPEYRSWSQMKDRCLNINNKDFPSYAGRGISVCERWAGKHGFINFLKDVGPRPEPKFSYSLERINNDGNYEPSNCRWATSKEQIANRRVKKLENFSNEEIYKEFVRRGLVCLET